MVAGQIAVTVIAQSTGDNQIPCYWVLPGDAAPAGTSFSAETTMTVPTGNGPNYANNGVNFALDGTTIEGQGFAVLDLTQANPEGFAWNNS